MNFPSFLKQRVVRSIAGPLAVLTYGVIMAITANHALTQADPVPQRTWEPTGKAASARQPKDQAVAANRPTLRFIARVTPVSDLSAAELRKNNLLFGPTVLGSNPADAARHPWPHTGEFIDDCSTTLVWQDSLQVSM